MLSRLFLIAALAAPLQGQAIKQILATGQSLQNGVCSTGGNCGGLSNANPNPLGNLNLSNFVSTVFDPLRCITVEFPGCGAANQAATMASSAYVITWDNAAQSGQDYASIKKGGTGTAYANSMSLLAHAITGAGNLGRSINTPAVSIVHGQQDEAIGTSAATYEADMVQMQGDYEADINTAYSVSGVTRPLLMTQENTWYSYNSPKATPTVAIGQYNAWKNNPGKIYLTGPTYQCQFSDSVHLIDTAYRDCIGQQIGKVYDIVVRQGITTWKPLSPDESALTVAGRVITAPMLGAVGSLVVDTTACTGTVGVCAPNKGACKGFEFSDSAGSTVTGEYACSGVSVSASTATITLTSNPTGTSPKLAYAYTGVVSATPNTSSAAMGNIRDSDTTTGWSGTALNNWLVAFEPKNLTIIVTPQLQVSPTLLSYSCTVGSSPSPQTVTITNPGAGTLDNWSASKAQSWLTLTPSSGSATGTFSAAVSCAGKTAGSYSDTITMASTTSNVEILTPSIPVSLTVSPLPIGTKVSGATATSGAVTIR